MNFFPKTTTTIVFQFANEFFLGMDEYFLPMNVHRRSCLPVGAVECYYRCKYHC